MKKENGTHMLWTSAAPKVLRRRWRVTKSCPPLLDKWRSIEQSGSSLSFKIFTNFNLWIWGGNMGISKILSRNKKKFLNSFQTHQVWLHTPGSPQLLQRLRNKGTWARDWRPAWETQYRSISVIITQTSLSRGHKTMLNKTRYLVMFAKDYGL